MKKLIAITMIFCLLFVQVAADTVVKLKKLDGTYFNSRYGFSIMYDKSVMKPMESANSDGAVLYNKSGNDIRTYAGFIFTDTFEETAFYSLPQTSTFRLFPFKNGYLIYDENKTKKTKSISLIVGAADTAYHVDLNVSDAFYKANKTLMVSMIKSLSVLKNKDVPLADVNYYLDNLDTIIGNEPKAYGVLKSTLSAQEMMPGMYCNDIRKINGKLYYLYCDGIDEDSMVYAVELTGKKVFFFMGSNNLKPYK